MSVIILEDGMFSDIPGLAELQALSKNFESVVSELNIERAPKAFASRTMYSYKRLIQNDQCIER